MTEIPTITNGTDLPQEFLTVLFELREACETKDSKRFIEKVMSLRLSVPHSDDLNTVSDELIDIRFRALNDLLISARYLPGFKDLIVQDRDVLGVIESTQNMINNRLEVMKVILAPKF